MKKRKNIMVIGINGFQSIAIHYKQRVEGGMCA
ncbi:hypothetical protein HNR31_001166 [Anoxybacillus caldiproteolyticus]|uniref:Uncharacterized protein n=1 Tax=Thermaerobacillus caldiproteolyticus TaxID=247480 RepID=A0A7V9Z5J3_9BACL|nr:hypothetical protein [Anoxybacillus caldiproteolyticus]